MMQDIIFHLRASIHIQKIDTEGDGILLESKLLMTS